MGAWVLPVQFFQLFVCLKFLMKNLHRRWSRFSASKPVGSAEQKSPKTLLPDAPLTPASSAQVNFFFIVFILFSERGEGKEKERERNINVWLLLTHPLLETWPATQACALTGNQTGDPSVPRLALNLLSHISQGKFNCFLKSTIISKMQKFVKT